MDERVSTSERTLGKEAQRANILAARVVADLVKTTLGPKGMDKMLVDATGNVTVTNDGVTILEELELEHPVAQLIVESAKTQESEVGDGTTTVAMLAGSLLEQAEKLLDRRIHPTVIIRGYTLAAEKALEIIKGLAVPVTTQDVLTQSAMTAMTGKGAEASRAHLADLIVRAVSSVAEGREVDTRQIKIVQLRTEGLESSELIQGMVIDKEIVHADMPRAIDEARIALLDFPLEIRVPETETKLSLTSPEQLRGFLESEEQLLRDMTSRIAQSGANVVFCQKGIDDVAQYYLAKAGIAAVRRVPKADMEKLSKATSARVTSHIHDVHAETLGYAQRVEERIHGQDVFTYVRGCKNPKAVTILLRGSTSHVIDELERALEDGIGVVGAAVREGHVVAGGGAIEIALAHHLRAFARTHKGREQLAIEAFAQALEVIPETLAENAGLDAIEIVTELKRRHATGAHREGINLLHDRVEDCLAAGVVEPLKVKTQAVSAATEVATMILRIDDVLVSKKKPVQQQSYQGMD